MIRSVSSSHPASASVPPNPVANFYREEFLKHLAVLRTQRGCFSETACASAERALERILMQLDSLCARQNACQVLGRLLASFDCVTGASSMSERKDFH